MFDDDEDDEVALPESAAPAVKAVALQPSKLAAESIERFLTAPWRKEGLAASTRKAYAYELTKLSAFLAPCELQHATEVQLREYLMAMHQRGVKAAGVRRATLALRSYYAWLSAEGGCASPAKALDARRAPRAVPRILGTVRVAALAQLQRDAPLRERLRDRALVEVASGTGLRLTELLLLKPVHIDLVGRKVTVWGSGAKCREVPLPLAAAVALNAYMEQGRPTYLREESPSEFVFLTRLGKRLTPSGLWRHLRTLAAAAGVEPARISAGALRQTFEADQLLGGASQEEVRALLGRASTA